jgi:putative peptidoglycan lipid II flippase
LLPVIGVFIVMAKPVIAVLFQRGEFNAQAVQLTGLALATYSLMILPFDMRDVITRVMYSLKDTWTPVINSAIMVILNVSLMALLVPRFGMVGITSSVAISTTFAFVRLQHKLVEKIGEVESDAKGIWFTIIANSLVFTVVAWLLYQGLMRLWPDPSGADLWLRTLTSIGISGLLYLVLTLRIKAPEVEWLRARLRLNRL